jgi:hypothetical protein
MKASLGRRLWPFESFRRGCGGAAKLLLIGARTFLSASPGCSTPRRTRMSALQRNVNCYRHDQALAHTGRVGYADGDVIPVHGNNRQVPLSGPAAAFSPLGGSPSPTTRDRKSVNPKGILPLSQGLRGTSYPGLGGLENRSTPTGLYRPVGSADATPLGLRLISHGLPRVARLSQPWAERRNPFGIGRRRRPKMWVMLRHLVGRGKGEGPQWVPSGFLGL